jgi:type 1 glutamine amidotransferase
VFYTSLGHFVADFDVPELREMTLRGMRWAAGGPEDVAIDGLPDFPR